MNEQSKIASVVPFSLKDAPAFIERQMPVGRVSAETYKERKAGAGQTLTALGSYWKGRKPLILVRATVLGCLLPATKNPLADLRIFLLLMGMNDAAFEKRIKSISAKDIDPEWPKYSELVENDRRPAWRKTLSKENRHRLIGEWLTTLPYDDRLEFCFRPEELDEVRLLDGIWVEVNTHLGTKAHSISELVEQLGIMRYGHRPKVADTFAGGGSIPFESARMGCDIYASDLNPIACMLTWGAFNIIGAPKEKRSRIESEQQRVMSAVDAEITKLAVEHDRNGNRANAYLYCLETKCPKTGWMVPMAPSWVISRTRNVVAKLIPDHNKKRYEIVVEVGVDAETLKAAETGTVQNGRLIHEMNPERDGVSISVIRGDYREDGENKNRIRSWDKIEFIPRLGDIWQERLYCIQWIKKESLEKARHETFFASVNEDDLRREKIVEGIVAENIEQWQRDGLVPDMQIEPGDKTDEPIRTRGWTYWHQLFGARHLLIDALFKKWIIKDAAKGNTAMLPIFCKMLDSHSKLTRWRSLNKTANITGGLSDKIENVFYNQAINTMINYGQRALPFTSFEVGPRAVALKSRCEIQNADARNYQGDSDLLITDPPYADAVNYHEITEYFIAWLRKNPPQPFDKWTWNSQRSMAIKGSDEKFRADMVAAYKAMTEHMPGNGMQIVMFTHQDAGVWADLAAIMWAAGLRVTAAWNIVTETASPLKNGNYVQGTILLVLRKRLGAGNAKRMDIESEIEGEVDKQIKALHDLSDDWTSERLYTDGDLQLAAYAAALRVITNYETIDRVQVGADVYRKLKKGERTVIRDLIDYAAGVANNKLVPEGFSTNLWRDLDKTSRFYVRMLDMEAKGTTKAADFMDFAKTFSVPDYKEFMASTKANEAALAGAEALKAKGLGGSGFGSEPLRRILFAVYKTIQKDDPKDGLLYLRNELGSDYWTMRAKLIEFAKFIAAKTARTRPKESAAADLLAQKLEVDRV